MGAAFPLADTFLHLFVRIVTPKRHLPCKSGYRTKGPHKVRCSSGPGRYTPYSLISDAASPIRLGPWREFSSWQILLFLTGTAGHIGGSFVD